MKKTKVSIVAFDLKTRKRSKEKDRVEIDAWDVGVPGLVVHRNTLVKADRTTLSTKGWAVTHVGSGLHVTSRAGVAKREDAVLLAELLEPYANWAEPEKVILKRREELKSLVDQLERQIA